MSKNNSQESPGIHLRNLATEWSKKPENDHIRREERFKGLVCCIIPPPSLCAQRDPLARKGSPGQEKRASFVAQLVKNLPAMRETLVRSLGWEDPLEKGEATHSSILAQRIPWIVQSMGVAKSWTGLSELHFHFAKKRRLFIAFQVTEQRSHFSFTPPRMAKLRGVETAGNRKKSMDRQQQPHSGSICSSQ